MNRLAGFLLALLLCSPMLPVGHCAEGGPLPASSHGRGLHATIGVATPGWSGDSRFVDVTFQLSNDSDRVLKSATSSWELVIDGSEAPDPGGQLWMGGQPTGGYETVRPGKTYRFGKSLPYGQYFPEARDYKVYWKSAVFKSNVIVVRGQTQP